MNISKIAPSLRFSEFTDEWQEKRLGEVCQVKSSKRIHQKDWKKSGIPFYRAREIVKFSKGALLDNPIFISLDMYKKIKASYDIPKKGDILVTGVGTIGIPFIVRDSTPFYFKDGNIIWLANINANSKWIYINLLDSRVMKNIHNNMGSTVKTFTIEQAKKLSLPFPSLSEQKKIADFLSVVDEKIEALRQKKQGFENYKKGVMQKIFNQTLRFRDEAGNPYPNWQEKKLGEVFKCLKGNGLSKSAVIEGGKNKCILYGELYTFYKETIKFVRSYTNIEEGTKSKKGDILMPSSTTTQGIDLANATSIAEDGVLLGGDIMILRFEEIGDSLFFAYYLTHHKKHDIANIAQGITIVHLSFNHLQNLTILPPSLPEQKKIADFLSALDEKIDNVTAQISQAENFKKFLMQKMFI